MEASVMRVKFYDFDDSTMHIEENIKDSKSLKRCDGTAIIINGGKLTCLEQLCGTDVCCQNKNCILPLPATPLVVLNTLRAWPRRAQLPAAESDQRTDPIGQNTLLSFQKSTHNPVVPHAVEREGSQMRRRAGPRRLLKGEWVTVGTDSD
jgi:hypothetical protein